MAQYKKRKRAAEQSDSSRSSRPAKKPTPAPSNSPDPLAASAGPQPVNPPPRPAATPRSQSSSSKPRPASHAPHDAVLAELRPKYPVISPQVISSSKIRARVTTALSHLRGRGEDGAVRTDGGPDGAERRQTDVDDDAARRGIGGAAPVVLLHARPGDVCKMMTIVEQVKRVAAADGATTWWQYNETFEPAPKPRPAGADVEVVDDEVVDDEAADDEVVDETVLPDSSAEGGGGGGAGGIGERERERERVFADAVLPCEPARRVRSLRVFLALAPVPELHGREGVTVQTNSKDWNPRM